MELGHVREFLALSETLSFSEAAQRLKIGEPVLTRHIQKLEAELGAVLFTRTTRKVSLSYFGQVFLPYARDLIRINGDCMNALKEASGKENRPLTIGMPSVASKYGITDVIAGFKTANPQCPVDMIEADSAALKKQLQAGKCDLIFAREESLTEPGFNRIPYVSDRLTALVPISHPLAGELTLRLEQLKDCKFLTFPKGTYMHLHCVRLCTAAGFKPDVIFSIFGEHNLVKLVENGLGISLLLKTPALLHNNPNVAVIDIEPPVISYINILYPKDTGLSPQAKVFLDFVRPLLDRETVKDKIL